MNRPDKKNAITRAMYAAMSTALSDLERVLGVQLLVRHHARGVSLTPAGEELLSDARALLRQAQELESAATQHGSGVTGRVTLGCFAILAPYVMPRLLHEVGERLPGVELATTEEALDGLAEGLRHGRLELTLGYDLGHSAGVRQRENPATCRRSASSRSFSSTACSVSCRSIAPNRPSKL